MSKMFNVRLEDDLRERIDEWAEKDPVPNTSTWVREALAGVAELGGLTQLAVVLDRLRRKGGASDASSNGSSQAHPAPHPARALAVQSRSLGAEEVKGCVHPKTGLKRLPYATVCGLCGVRIR